MKKILSALSVLLLSTAAEAQEYSPYFNVVSPTYPTVVEDLHTSSLVLDDVLRRQSSLPRRALSDGVYYTKPLGSMYNTFVYEDEYGGNYWGATSFYRWLVLPAWHVGTFVNMSNHKEDSKWYINGTDVSASQDEDHNLSLELEPSWAYTNGPVLECDNIKFRLSDLCTDTYGSYVVARNEFNWLGFVDNGWTAPTGNALNTYYAVGTGKYTGELPWEDSNGTRWLETGTYPCAGGYQTFPAPASPLYVRKLYLDAAIFTHDTSFDPIKNEGALTVNIYDTATGEILQTLTTGPGNYTYWHSETFYTTGETYIVGRLGFHKVVDASSSEDVDETFIIDRPVTVEVTGFENTENFTDDLLGCGLRLNKIGDADTGEEELRPMFLKFYNPNREWESVPYLYYNNYALSVRFDAIMDRVFVADALSWNSGALVQNGYATLRLSADGKTCKNDIDVADDYNLGGLYVTTCLPWYDEDTGEECYSLTEMPDWITGVQVDTSNYKPSEASYWNVMSFTATPNEGEERSFTAYVQGRGYTDSQFVTIIQDGGYVYPEGLTAVSSSSSTAAGAFYNLAGQRVSGNVHGVVVQDGKKVMNK